MPKINRIRIANIQYDKKIIKDLMLNCYSGENVLLNLANGGGKSVLVQLMGQPIMPESKIHNREVYSYLSPDQPSYILIEWKLDNTEKTYLLTGIVMSKQYSSDDMNKTKYFTFINEYKKSNEFDIKNIPFIEKQENATIYKSFETAKKLISENKNIESLRTYGRAEQREYRKKLAEYGIFINEWKLLSKINENEGGVDELFKDCKTSDRLVNKWILKTISDSNEAEGKELRDMFVSLMQEIIEKESNIKEKETLEKFKKEIEEYEEIVKDLTKKLDTEKQVEININNIYLNLQKLSQENQEKIEKIEYEIAQNEKELKQIEYEEISEEYYKKQSDLEVASEENNKKQEELEVQQENLEKAKHQYRLQKVAYIYQKEKEAIAKIQALEQTRTSLQNKNGTDNQIIQIEYSLQEQYKKEEQNLQEQIKRIEEQNKEIKENISKWKIQKEQTQKNIAEYSNKIGSLEQKIEQFKQEEKSLFQKMNIILTRNLLNELEEKEVQKIKESLEKQEQELENKIQENEQQIQTISKKIKEANKEEEENNKKIEELTKEITQKIDTFNYKEKDKKEIEQEILSLERQIEEKKEENQNYKENKEKWEQEIENKKYENQEKSEQLKESKTQKQDFAKYIENNTYYITNVKEKQNYENEIKISIIENEKIENQIEEADKKSKENVVSKSSLTYRLEEINKRQIKIPKREAGIVLNIPIEQLEAQYEILSNEYKQNMDAITKELSNWNKIKEEKTKEKQKDYGDLKEEDYIDIIYSEEMEDLAKEKKEEEENKLKEVMQIANDKTHIYIKIETQFQETKNNLKKIGKEEPISASQIKGNYTKRREDIKVAKEDGKKKQKEYIENNKKITYQINEIARKIDVKNIEQEIQKIDLEKIDLEEQLNKYTQLKKENQTNKEISYRKNLEISNNHKDKHRIINKFLESIKTQDVQGGTFETYYFIYERIGKCIEKLTDYIEILNLSLKNIERDKKNILEHAVKQGKMLYEEMREISESSRIKIGERYVQILKIDIPQELKEYVEKRIESHIESCIQGLREECKHSDDIRKTIESKVMIYLSDRQLLNLTLDIETIKVKLYKFDIENKNSGLRQWEEVIVENSGGQKFIACFSLLSALTQYTRKKELENMGEDEKAETSKVFILDNPFGKTSSKHLLEPMLEISKRFNTQMICLSDLSQSSITDKFTLIYQLALRSSKYTSNSFLNIEEARINGDVAVDTSLEQVYLRSKVEQLNLFE